MTAPPPDAWGRVVAGRVVETTTDAGDTENWPEVVALYRGAGPTVGQTYESVIGDCLKFARAARDPAIEGVLRNAALVIRALMPRR